MKNPQRNINKKITASVPAVVLRRAQRATRLGITATVLAGLESLAVHHALDSLRGMRGKVHLNTLPRQLKAGR